MNNPSLHLTRVASTLPFTRPVRPLPAGARLAELIERAKKRDATARTRIGRKVRSVEELVEIAASSRSVYVEGCLGLRPAAFVVSMQARFVAGLIRAGRVRRYTAPTKKNRSTASRHE